MKLLLLGKNGQVGRELQRSLAPLGELVALDRHSTDFCGDLRDLAGLANTVRAVRPEVIVNAAAYTAVDRAESEPELARAVNALAPAVLAAEAAKLGAWLVHYSTDYVFDGSGQRPWRETDAVAPLNVYGRTKLDGERLVQEGCARHLIFRTSWVHSASGRNFIGIILGLARECDSLSVVDDQIGAPTDARLVADVTAHALSLVCGDAATSGRGYAGLYHVAAQGEISRYGFARWIVDQALRRGVTLALAPDQIRAIGSANFPQVPGRPANSRLDSGRLEGIFGLALPPWQTGAEYTLDEMLQLSDVGDLPR